MFSDKELCVGDRLLSSCIVSEPKTGSRVHLYAQEVPLLPEDRCIPFGEAVERRIVRLHGDYTVARVGDQMRTIMRS